MTDHTRPLLLGYIRTDVLLADDDISLAKANIEAFADREGFTLGTVYVEWSDTSPAGFHALAEELGREEDAFAIVVPNMRHVAGREHRAMRRRIERVGGRSILAADVSP